MKRSHPPTSSSKPPPQPTPDDEEEDDYMSMTFLSESDSNTKKKSQELTYSQRRQKEMEEARRRGTVKSLKDREQEAREAGLSTPLASDETNKGFMLLSKLGFKKGMTLGKQSSESSALAEPLPIHIRSSKHGLGVPLERPIIKRHRPNAFETPSDDEEHEDSDANEPNATEDHSANARPTLSKKGREAYRSQVIQRLDSKRLLKDVRKARRTIQTLDELASVERHAFWPLEPPPKVPEEERGIMMGVGRVEEVEGKEGLEKYVVELDEEKEESGGNDGGEEEVPIPEPTFEELEPEDQLPLVINYLRAKYLYCLWCGDRYQSTEEMGQHCPGPLKDDHEDM
ncbi:G patch domain-containing protein 11 [Chytridiales sp. JEL 0842]|nr:G patch domain-containing protein 11 [Chytridiales sp. JEL 0842]